MQSVLKFGGAALADGATLRRSLRHVQGQLDSASHQAPIVVVSALAGVTDDLYLSAKEAAMGQAAHPLERAASRLRIRHHSVLSQLGLSSELLGRHLRDLSVLLAGIAQQGRLEAANLDLVLSFGERMSARIFAAALEQSGVEATPVDAWDVGLLSDSNHGQAQPVDGIQPLIRKALRATPGVPVVTGFLAQNQSGQLTTLGRNGSDLTAALLAEAVGASELVFYKDVAGIHSADPKRIAAAFPLDLASYAEAAELAFHGSAVLHPAAVAPAIRAQVPVRILPIDPKGAQAGTLLVPRIQREGPTALACRNSSSQDLGAVATPAWATIALVGHDLTNCPTLPGRAQSILEGEGIAVHAGLFPGRPHSFAFGVCDADLNQACQLLHQEILVPSLMAV